MQRQLQWGRIRVVEDGGSETFGWIHSADGKHYQLHDRLAMLEGIDMEQEVQAELCTLGIPREPWDFVDRAIKAGHPRSLAIHLSGDVMEMLKQNFAEEPYKVIKERANFLKRWTNRCKELEAQERTLHNSLAPHLQEVLQGKRLRLMKGVMSLKDAEKLRGRLQWFETFAGGRVAQQALRSLSRMASTGRQTERLTGDELNTIHFLRARVICAPPTRISSTSLQTWLIFTDGACEGEDTKVGSIGAVLINPSGIAVEYISERAPDSWMAKFLSISTHHF